MHVIQETGVCDVRLMGLLTIAVSLSLACDRADQAAVTSTGPGATSTGLVAISTEPLRSLPQDADGKELFADPVSATRLSSGVIVVADRRDAIVRFFNSEGRLIREVGRRGAGPGEFERINQVMQCAADSVFVWDPIQPRMTVIDSAGKVIREFNLPGRPGLVRCSTHGTIAILMQPLITRVPDPDGTGPTYQSELIVANTRGEKSASAGEVPAFQNRPLGKVARLTAGPGGIYLGTQDSAFVRHYSDSMRASGDVGIGSLGRLPTRQIYEHVIEVQLAQVEQSPQRDAIRDFMLKIPMPAELPPYFDLFADGEGNLWAQINAPGEGRTELRGVKPDGSELAVISLPIELQVLEVGSDYLLGSTENEAGERRIVEYALARR